MIVSATGERLTPKQLAQEIIMSRIATAMYPLYEEHPELTDRERELVAQHVNKQKERVEKLFGYEPGSWRFM